MKKWALLLGSLLLFASPAVDAQRRGVSDNDIVAHSSLAASGSHVELYQHGVAVDAAFLDRIEDAYLRVESVLGVKFDTATLGDKVRVYVSNGVGISHVWRGYDHPRDPKAIIFLNPRVVAAAINRRNATYISELTHLYPGRFSSHPRREGLADHVALALLPGAAVGPNTAGRRGLDIAPEIREYLGTTKSPPAWLSTDSARRADYYFASYRLVNMLVGLKGMATFMKLYASADPERALQDLYGLSREQAIQKALDSQTQEEKPSRVQ